jgi:hypothetical protein
MRDRELVVAAVVALASMAYAMSFASSVWRVITVNPVLQAIAVPSIIGSVLYIANMMFIQLRANIMGRLTTRRKLCINALYCTLRVDARAPRRAAHDQRAVDGCKDVLHLPLPLCVRFSLPTLHTHLSTILRMCALRQRSPAVLKGVDDCYARVLCGQ